MQPDKNIAKKLVTQIVSIKSGTFKFLISHAGENKGGVTFCHID